MHIPARAIVGFAAFSLLIPASLLLAGGDPGWTMGWALAALFVVSMVGSRLVAIKKSPGLVQERARFGGAEDAEPWDRWLSLLVGLVGPFSTVVVAGLDHRFRGSSGVPSTLQTVSMGVVALGYLLAIWAMLENAFFSAVVRIQRDRGHTVVGTGPYAVVRHPAYAGGILSTLATPFALNALWALIPSCLTIIVLVHRTSLEDRTLRRGLAGYEGYAARVKSRLLPGVW